MLKFSEAIRLGAMLKPQAFGKLQDAGGSCAYGAALDACGIQDQDNVTEQQLCELFPITTAPASCPVCGLHLEPQPEPWQIRELKTVDEVITHLNDWHRWTRERIADFVETLETPQAADAVARTEGIVTG